MAVADRRNETDARRISVVTAATTARRRADALPPAMARGERVRTSLVRVRGRRGEEMARSAVQHNTRWVWFGLLEGLYSVVVGKLVSDSKPATVGF